MKHKLTIKEYILVASMLFGLFFGAGNLIFPVSMGQQAGDHTLLAAIGFCITGVGLPLLGIASMAISESTGLFDMSSKVGKGFAYFFTCALYLTIGPLFAIPRTATVSFTVGVAPLVSKNTLSLALLLFTLVFFALVLFFSLKPSGILTWVGKILNPLFLLFLGVLILFSLFHPMGSMAATKATGGYTSNAFFTGFLEGYNTMDALASLAFGIILIEVIQNLGVTDPRRTSLTTIKSGFFSTLLMALIYCALSFMGAQSVSIIGVSSDGGTALNLIARHYFGGIGGLFLGIMITFACLKTAIGLVTACSTTFSELFPHVCTYKRCAVVFTLFSLLISNAGLSAILQVSLPVLLFLYPLTIVLIILGLIGRLFAYKKPVLLSTMLFTIIASFLGIVGSLPFALPFAKGLAHIYTLLPFASIGMGWITPALFGLILGFLLNAFWPQKTYRRY